MTADTLPTVAGEYEMQMLVYALAAERILKCPPVELVLCFLRPGLEYHFVWNAAARQRVVELVNRACHEWPTGGRVCRAIVAARESGYRSPCVQMLAPMRAGTLLTPEEQRRFAVEVVRRLRGAGFEAYWAGGCVRDQLLGRTPKDYDVATNAVPDQVRALFGRRRTLAIGAAFGVIAVIGPQGPGTVEVTTFRRDAPYSDGRHPDSVTFSSAEEDASRRDFTINGLFYDPVEQRVIDFVGGQEDLAQRRLRAIGDARQRFAEDKLRMLRAVRFAATFAFSLDERDASGHCRHGRRNPRRQPRADRHGNAADAGRSQPCGRACD